MWFDSQIRNRYVNERKSAIVAYRVANKFEKSLEALLELGERIGGADAGGTRLARRAARGMQHTCTHASRQSDTCRRIQASTSTDGRAHTTHARVDKFRLVGTKRQKPQKWEQDKNETQPFETRVVG